MRSRDEGTRPGGLTRRALLSTGITGVAASLATASTRQTDRRPVIATPRAPDDLAWVSIRAQFDAAPGLTYLNNASVGMPPRAVTQRVAEGYRALSRNPTQAKEDLRAVIADDVRPSLASELGADPSEISLTRNATESLYLAATGTALGSGDEVVFTSQEHPAGRSPWEYLAATRGIRATEVFIPSPFGRPAEVVERLADRLTARTRVLAFCHVTRGGHLYPVQQLTAMARDHGALTIVDGAQAVGMFPIDLHDLGCDVYAASLHKWMLGPIGTGMLYVSQDARDRLRSIYTADASGAPPAYEPGGTVDLPPRAALAAALEFLRVIGIDQVAGRNRYLSDYLKDQLKLLRGFRLLSNATPETSAPGSTIFEIAGLEPLELLSVLASRDGLHVDEHTRDGHNAFRVSTHYYNSIEEIDQLVLSLNSLRG